MKTKLIVTASTCVALLVLLAASPALAQKGSFEIGIGGGLMELDDKLGGDTGLNLDLRAGYFVTDRFEIEIQNLQASTILEGSFTATTLNALYHFEVEGDFIPYLLVGAGTADVEEDSGLFVNDRTDDGTALRLGAGGRFWIGERQRFSTRVEIAALSEDSFDDDSTHIGLTITAGWRFGS